MAIRAKTNSWQVILLLVLAVGLWGVEKWRPGLLRGWRDHPAVPPVAADGKTQASAGKPAVVNGYERFDGCQWVDHRQNDGDSFRLRLPDGRVEQFRLYFVDTPESAFRQYGGGRNNHQRIHEQALEMRVSDKEVVEIGQDAKHRVEAMLKGKPLTIYTEWDDPFGDRRFHAFVEMPGGGWLHEWLAREGLVRVHTKGAPLPDGTPESAHRRELQRLARKALESK
ncbi:hypothetical protein [Haloferula sargassicola]|uniref:TNase-like domain-containing protein n=1 Tax=Haloferula sargassicola TaxID=490096 RepID=A0ABP9UMK0_9BACT